MGNLLARFIFVDQLLQKLEQVENFGRAHFINMDFCGIVIKGNKYIEL
jgi:hypothetical protein